MKEIKEVPARGGPCGPLISARYLLAILGCFGMGIIYGLKVNLHVAIVAMVNHTAINVNKSHEANGSVCGTPEDAAVSNTAAVTQDGPLIWSHVQQGVILSAYFWGYIVAQLPGGRVAELFSARWVMFFAVTINVVCTILTPVTATLHWGVFILMRVGEGIGGGVTFPAMHVLLAHWAPPNERSVMSSIVYAGTALGTVIFMLLAGIIAGNVGWEAVFYIQGGVSAVWLLAWIIFVADSPQQQRFISKEEREYIMTSLNQSDEPAEGHSKNLKVPWKSVFTSMPFLAILVAHTCSNWGWYMVLIELPLYMKSILNFKINESAWLTALPFLCMWVFTIGLSKTLDTLRAKNLITTSIARKVSTLFASVVPMVCLIALCYIGCERTLGVVLMTIAVTGMGGMFCGFLSNHIDIAPNFAGTLMAITNTAATIPGIVVPNFVGALTEKDPSVKSWQIVFWVTVVLLIIEAVFYTIFGSGEEQKWNNPEGQKPDEAQPLKPQITNNKEDKV